MLEFVHELGSYYGHGKQFTPIKVAARRFQKTTVELIFESRIRTFETHALAGAARAGSLEIARFLIGKNVAIRRGFPEPIICAVQAEHTEMIELLRENGALTVNAKKNALKAAREDGLESMVELLESYDCFDEEARDLELESMVGLLSHDCFNDPFS